MLFSDVIAAEISWTRRSLNVLKHGGLQIGHLAKHVRTSVTDTLAI